MAQVNRINGQTELNCRIAVSGDLQDCIVIDESPAGFGFGAAALKMAPSFRVRPESVDGRPIAGAQVEIPINFEMR